MQIFCFFGVKIYVIGQSIGLQDSVITRLIQNKRCALGKWSGHFWHVYRENMKKEEKKKLKMIMWQKDMGYQNS